MDRRLKVFLLIIILFGTLLRIWGINFGLPYQFHQDEPIIVNHALAYGTGDLNPHFFIIPPLTSYILFFFYGIYYFIFHALGLIKGTVEFAINFYRDPTPFYLIGRAFIGILPSISNIYLTYKLAAKFVSKKAALYSALVMAIAFLNVANGHFIYTDNLLVMFSLLAYLAIANTIGSPSLKNYILSGLLIGMATAVKYNAILLAVPFTFAFLTHPAKETGKRAFIGAAIIIAAFILFNPYALIDWKFFLGSVTGKIRQGYMGWTHHIVYSLFEGFGASATVLGVAGLFVFTRKIRNGLFLISFPAVFYLHLVFKSQVFSRYALILVPFLSIGIGFLFYDYIYPKLQTRLTKTAVIVLSMVILLYSGAKSVKTDILFTKKDTREQATEWIKQNIHEGAKIALDHTFFSPPLRQDAGQLKDKEAIINNQPELMKLKEKKIDFQIRAIKGEKTYEVYYIIHGNENVGQFITFWPVIKDDPELLRRKGIEYIVINNTKMPGGTPLFQEEVARKCEKMAQFSPYYDHAFRRPYDEIETTCVPILSKELFSRERFGPCLIIYKIK